MLHVLESNVQNTIKYLRTAIEVSHFDLGLDINFEAFKSTIDGMRDNVFQIQSLLGGFMSDKIVWMNITETHTGDCSDSWPEDPRQCCRGEDKKPDTPCRLFIDRARNVSCTETIESFLDLVSGINSFDVTNGSIMIFRERSLMYLDIANRVQKCYGDYFTTVRNVSMDLQSIKPNSFDKVKEDLQLEATSSELRAMYAPLYQDQRMIEEIIRSYKSGRMTKNDIVEQLAGNQMAGIASRIERYVILKIIL